MPLVAGGGAAVWSQGFGQLHAAQRRGSSALCRAIGWREIDASMRRSGYKVGRQALRIRRLPPVPRLLRLWLENLLCSFKSF